MVLPTYPEATEQKAQAAFCAVGFAVNVHKSLLHVMDAKKKKRKKEKDQKIVTQSHGGKNPSWAVKHTCSSAGL